MSYKALLGLVTSQSLVEDAAGLLKSMREVSLHLSVLCYVLCTKNVPTSEVAQPLSYSHRIPPFTSLRAHCYQER